MLPSPPHLHILLLPCTIDLPSLPPLILPPLLASRLLLLTDYLLFPRPLSSTLLHCLLSHHLSRILLYALLSFLTVSFLNCCPHVSTCRVSLPVLCSLTLLFTYHTRDLFRSLIFHTLLTSLLFLMTSYSSSFSVNFSSTP